METWLRSVARIRITPGGPSVGAVLFGAAGTILAGYFASRVEPVSMALLLPFCMLCTIGLAFGVMLQRLSGGALQYFELGLVFCGCVLLYGAYPLASFLLSGQTYTDLGDVRLFDAQPRSSDIARIGWYYVLFLACFALAYLGARGRVQRNQVKFDAPGLDSIAVIVFLILLAQLFFQSVRFFFGDPSHAGYGGRYLAYLHLPLLVHQIANHLDGVVLTLSLLLLTALMARWERARVWIMAWLGAEVVVAITIPGSRTRLFLLLVGFVLSYHYMVKPLALRTIASGVLLGLSLFIVLGALRTLRMLADMGVTQSGLPLLGGTEFESLFVNAFDLERRKAAGLTEQIVPVLYVVDLMRLVPQQLLPWDKLDLADWYVQTFYPEYARMGGGLAFGVIAESVLGLGATDLIWRGLVVGLLLGAIQRHFAHGGATYLRFVLYLWIVLMSYQIVRNTTFTLVPLFVYQFLPAVVTVALLSRLVRVMLAHQARR